MTIKEIYYNSFIYLLYKVTPNLRYIFLDFDNRQKNTIIIKAYYESPASEMEKELLDDLASDIIGMIDELYYYEIEINVSVEHLDQLKKTEYLLFARFEGIGF